jgi:probable phosphoglycerate mutase
LLLRHAQSEWNAKGLWQGWADPPLSDEGRRQASEAGLRLRGEGLTSVAASDLRRSRETARRVVTGLGLTAELHIESDLREYDVGAWSGLTHPQIEAAWPGALEAWRDDQLEATPGGERRQRFVARITGAICRLGQSFAGQKVLVVTHGGVIDALERWAGAERRAVPYVGGRWFSVSGEDVQAGQAMTVLGEDPAASGDGGQPAR